MVVLPLTHWLTRLGLGTREFFVVRSRNHRHNDSMPPLSDDLVIVRLVAPSWYNPPDMPALGNLHLRHPWL